jgi:ABC-type uncharacterized transport system auxiliary subunit
MKPFRPVSAGRLPGSSASVLVAFILLAGCLSKPALVRQHFALSIPPVAESVGGEGVWLLRPVTISPLFDGESFTYRTGEQSYERDPYAGFLAAPARVFGDAIRAHLLARGVCADLVESGSAVKPDRVVEAHVTRLFGDFRPGQEAAAVLSLRLTLLEAASGAVLLRREVEQRMLLKDRTAAALAAGWEEALNRAMAELVPALQAAPGPSPAGRR